MTPEHRGTSGRISEQTGTKYGHTFPKGKQTRAKTYDHDARTVHTNRSKAYGKILGSGIATVGAHEPTGIGERFALPSNLQRDRSNGTNGHHRRNARIRCLSGGPGQISRTKIPRAVYVRGPRDAEIGRRVPEKYEEGGLEDISLWIFAIKLQV